MDSVCVFSRICCFRSIDAQSGENKAGTCFEIVVFLKKKFAITHHVVGCARISTVDFVSCLESKNLTFPLHKQNRTGSRGDILLTLQFEVSFRDSNIVESVRPGHYKRITQQLINRVVLHTLRELPKGAEYVFVLSLMCLFFF
jgi:hypothetical protein